MANRSSFTAEDWETLQFTAHWVAGAVASADGTVDAEEEMAFNRALMQTVELAGATPTTLWEQVVVSLTKAAPDMLDRYANDQRSVQEGLGDAADILERHLPAEEAEEFKRAVWALGISIATASGGDRAVAKQHARELRDLGMPKDFAAMAGERFSRMSEDEKLALEIVQAALRLSTPVR